MAMTQLDKIKLLNIIKKNIINSYKDLYIDTRNKISIYDILDTTINIVIKLMKESKSEKTILNSLHAIEIIFEEMDESDFEIDISIFKRINEFKHLDTFNNEEITKTINNIINSHPKYEKEIIEKENYSEDNQKVSISEDLDKLNQVIQNYEIQIEELNKKILSLKHKRDNDVKKSNDKINKIKKLEKEVERLKKEISRLKGKYDHLEHLFNQVSEELKEKEDEVSKLTSKTEYYYEMCVSMDEHSKIIDTLKKQKMIDEEVLEILSTNRVTIPEILRILSEKGLNASFNSVLSAISELSKTYEIDDSVLVNFEKAYNIISRKAVSNRIFNVRMSYNHFDCILLSDVHISNLKDLDIETFDKIYDYMIKYGVNTIIDTGDFIEVNHLGGTTRDDRIKYNDTIISAIIKSFPFEKGIKHLLLGGNHEADFLRYGIDPLEILESNREDFISLGYSSSHLKFNNDYVSLFHPSKRLANEEDKMGTLLYLDKYVNMRCNDASIKREDVMLSLFGHYHVGNFFNSGIITVPSLFRDRKKDGLLHLRFHFEGKDDKRIKDIEVTRLTINGKVNQQETYVYQRELKKD